MDKKTMITEHLALAERHVARGEQLIERQRQLVLGLDWDGHETVQAKTLLRQFEELQSLYVGDRDRLRRELADTKL